RKAIFCHFPHYVLATNNYPATSVRKGKWKLIKVYGEGENRASAYELYNLDKDEGENNNLASKMPDKVKKLNALILEHVNTVGGIFPVKNPAYVPDTPNNMGKRKEFPLEKYMMY
ncbi:MAG TPA: hypothetical protein VFM79_06190, partial [Pelobium sp.]|nr:hypothetical protein [Pelobium sp.]